ncbi:MAG: DUF6273 domain-containing protein [Oscillospiraceae bacterium]|nr:DUF6273 domain-containing protein [Oscillospiraceae bacterium]
MALLEEMVSKLAQGTVDTDNSKDKVGQNNNMKKSKKRVITFGRWENQQLEWTVLREDKTKVFCLCNMIPYYYDLDRNTKFEMSYAYDCLEKKFYNEAFSKDEQKLIVNHKIEDENKVMKCNVFLLSEEESEKLLSKSQKKLDMNWLLRDCVRKTSNELSVRYINYEGELAYKTLYDDRFNSFKTIMGSNSFKMGLRPAIIIRK